MVAVLGGPRWKAIYHVPLPLALSLEEQAGTCVHELPTLPPPQPSSLSLRRFDTEEREHGGLEYARLLNCIFTLSIKALKVLVCECVCVELCRTEVSIRPQQSAK